MQQEGIHLRHLALKIVIAAAVVLFTDYAVATVFYPSFFQDILVGVVLGVIGYYVERSMLRPGTVWIVTGLDIVVATIVVYVSQFLLPGARITLDGALLTALFFGIVEYFYHRRWVHEVIEEPPKTHS